MKQRESHRNKKLDLDQTRKSIWSRILRKGGSEEEEEDTWFLGLTIGPFGEGEVNLLAAHGFSLEWFFQTVPDQIRADV